ncbi:presequence protease [Holotrichia oblita]|nr:presequence protease [Holotrichia oblita]
MFSCYHRLFKGAKQPDLDNFSTAVTLRTIEKYSPDLIMLHLTDVDTHKHIYGPDSKEAMLAVSRLDKRLGQIQAAVKSAGLEDVTNYIILGDHACLPVSRGVDPNEFVKDLSGNFHLAGGTAFLVLHNPEDKEKAIERMKTVIQSPENGIKRLLSKEEMNIGGFSKEYALGIEACDKVAFGNPKKGQHGYGLDRKDYETFYLAAGPDVNAGQYEGGCIVDIAPLATKLLKIAPWEMDAFKTLPNDDTGLPHIMEHSVLAGSRKYPVKEPFNELMKGSLHTFLNAMTYNDKTVYPIASCNDKDYYNLMEVYLDAVFYPKIYDRKESFLQEGWHYSIHDRSEPVKYNGIVYNEMKGAFSDPSTLLDMVTIKSLFPDNDYRNESGGYPDSIPELTYDDFLDFHRKHYHPANSIIYLYGNLDLEKSFEILHKDYLSNFSKEDYRHNIRFELQNSLEEYTFSKAEYSLPATSDTSDKNLLSAGFVIGRYDNSELYYAFKILSNILLGTEASPLKKALVDAKLGEDISGYYFGDLLQPIFNVTVKNSKYDANKLREVMFQTLEELSKNGLDRELVEACINKTDFYYREEDYGYSPKGLIYNLLVLSNCLYGGEPFEKLEKLGYIEKIRSKALNERYFENLIDQYLISNKHATFCTLSAKQASLTEEQLDALIQQTKDLKAFQERKDAPEDLKKIPFVKISDIDKQPEKIPFEALDRQGFNILYAPQDTNKIVYANLLFDTSSVLSNRINSMLGGLRFSFETYDSCIEIGKFKPVFLIKAKFVENNMVSMFKLVEEIINNTLFDDKGRVRDVLLELKASLETSFLNRGHSVSMKRAASYISRSGKYNDEVQGVAFYQKLASILDNFEDSFEQLAADLSSATKSLFHKASFDINLTCQKEFYNKAEMLTNAFYDGLKDTSGDSVNYILALNPKNEAFATSSLVQYNALAADYNAKGHPYSGLLRLTSHVISNTYFMNEIRIKGGAYGFGSVVALDGLYYFYSYRDPHVSNTFDTYNNTADFIKNYDVSREELDQNIIGTINDLDRYLLPSQKGELALRRYLIGCTENIIQQNRLQVLDASISDIQGQFAVFENAMKDHVICFASLILKRWLHAAWLWTFHCIKKLRSGVRMKQKKQPLFLEGVISVEAAMLARNREINCIYISKSRRKQNRDILNLQNLAKKLGIPVWKVNEDFINLQANGHTHGGVLASVGEKEKIDVRQLIKNGKFIVAIDGIEDPFNLGYSIRTLYAAGVDGVLLPNRSWSNADGIISRSFSRLVGMDAGSVLFRRARGGRYFKKPWVYDCMRCKVESVWTAYACYRYGKLDVLNVVIMFCSLICFDMATTAINNYIDFKKANKKEGYGYEMHNAMHRYQIKERDAVATIIILLILAVLSGCLLVYRTNVIVLMLGVFSFGIGIIYTFGPIPISRTPLGELFSGGVMGLIIPFLAVYIHVSGEAMRERSSLMAFGYDFNQVSWESFERDAEVKGFFVTVLADANILYSKNEADKQRFLYLRAKFNANLANPQYMFERGLEWLNNAMKIYKTLLFEDTLYKVRKAAGAIMKYLAVAIACYNQIYNKSFNRLEDLKTMKQVPNGLIEQCGQIVLESGGIQTDLKEIAKDFNLPDLDILTHFNANDLSTFAKK